MTNSTDTLELPHEVYTALLKVAQISGVSPAEWIAAHLPQRENGSHHKRQVTPVEIEAANAKLRETIITLGYSTGSDNESIDADLAREYGEDHFEQEGFQRLLKP